MPNKLFLIVAGAFVGDLDRLGARLLLGPAPQRQADHARRAPASTGLTWRARASRNSRPSSASQREVDERLYPDPVRLAGLVAHRRHLWERRPLDGDFLSFRLGRAAVPLACPIELALSDDPLTEYQPELYEQAEAARRSAFARSRQLSVVASLRDAGVVTVTGPRERVVGLTRTILAQTAAFRAPADLRIMASFRALAGARLVVAQVATARARRPPPRARAPVERPGAAARYRARSSSRCCSRSRSSHASNSCAGSKLRREPTAPTPAIDAPQLLVVLDDFHAGSEIARLPLIRELAARGRQAEGQHAVPGRRELAEPPEAALRVLVSDERRGGARAHGRRGIPGRADGDRRDSARRVPRRSRGGSHRCASRRARPAIDLAAEVTLAPVARRAVGRAVRPDRALRGGRPAGARPQAGRRRRHGPPRA